MLAPWPVASPGAQPPYDAERSSPVGQEPPSIPGLVLQYGSWREPHAVEQLSITQGFVQFDCDLGRRVSLTHEDVSDRGFDPSGDQDGVVAVLDDRIGQPSL
jgi:hypothetical protein